jgi:hypothetical protein
MKDPSCKKPKKAKFPYFPPVNPPNIEYNPTVGGHPECSLSIKYLAFLKDLKKIKTQYLKKQTSFSN